MACRHPLLAPRCRLGLAGNPLLLVVDDSWAAAKDWDKRRAILQDLIASAEQSGVPVAFATTAPIGASGRSGATGRRTAPSKLAALEPKALDPDRMALLERLKQTYATEPASACRLASDGLDHGSARAFAEGLLGLAGGSASLEVLTARASSLPLALAAPAIEGGRIKVAALRASDAGEREDHRPRRRRQWPQPRRSPAHFRGRCARPKA